jgi:hypothetical protein
MDFNENWQYLAITVPFDADGHVTHQLQSIGIGWVFSNSIIFLQWVLLIRIAMGPS